MSHIKEFEHLKIQLEVIKSATNDFADDYCIGGGGFGKVYKGEIDHSKGQHTMVAFKRLDRKFGQGDPEFWKEIMMLSFYKHENIVSLVGYCDDSGEKILVYEYAPKKSLDAYLNYEELNWVQRLKICIGAARGLAYLHTPMGSQLRVLHRDIKSSNILLDENWIAKIADFGLSKFGPTNHQFSFLVSYPVGTPGYWDPLYIESGLLTKESDVYSFGVVLFEVLCGRLCISNINDEQRYLIGLVRKYYEENNISELTYVSIKDEIEPDSLKAFTEIAYQCIHKERKKRPLMTHIVGKLESSLKYQEAKAKAIADAKVRAEADAKAELDAKAEAEAKARAVTKAMMKVRAGGNEKAYAMKKGVGILNGKVLKVTVIETSRELLTASNSYLILHQNYFHQRKTTVKTSVKHNEPNPEWNEEFKLYVEDINKESLHIHVIKVISENKHYYVGTTKLILENLTPEIPETCDLEIMDNRGYDCIGKIMIELVYKPLTYDQFFSSFEDLSAVQKAPRGTPQDGGLLVVIIRHAEFPDEDRSFRVSVSLLFRGQLKETPSMTNTTYPIWEQEFIFMLEQPPRREEDIHFEVIDNNDNLLSGQFYGKKKYIGSANIRIMDLVGRNRTTHMLNLTTPVSYSYGHLDVELQWRTSD